MKSLLRHWLVHYAGGVHVFDNEDDARHAAARAMLRVEGPFVLEAEQLQGAEAIIRELVRANDSPDGAIGDVRARVGDEAAEQLRGILGGQS